MMSFEEQGLLFWYILLFILLSWLVIFVSSLRNICPTPIGKLWRFSTMQFPQIWLILILFLCILWGKDISSICTDSQFFHHRLLKTMLSYRFMLVLLSKINFYMFKSISGLFFSDPLIYMSIFMLLQHCFHYYSFILSLKVRLYKFSNLRLLASFHMASTSVSLSCVSSAHRVPSGL